MGKEPMTKDEALAKLRALADGADPETEHYDADHVLLDFINDDDIREAWNAVSKWWS